MRFPKRYPYEPPEFKFSRPLWHPNIYKDGKLCISILHQPGDDEMSGELASVSLFSGCRCYITVMKANTRQPQERWSPAQRVESVLLSIISLLDDAEVSSPANVDAGVMLRKQPDEYKKKVKGGLHYRKSRLWSQMGY